MLDKITENRWKLISILTISFIVLTTLSLIIPYFDFGSYGTVSYIKTIINMKDGNYLKTITRIVIPFVIIIIIAAGILLFSSIKENNTTKLFVILACIIFIGTIYFINDVLSKPISPYQDERLQFMFLRYLTVINVVGIVFIYFSDTIKEKLS